VASPTAPRLVVLHRLGLRGFASVDELAGSVGVDSVEVDQLLAGAESTGLARRREGRLAGWLITSSGRDEVRRLLADQLDAAGARSAVEDAYRRFLAVNAELLATCTAWQVSDEATSTLNDHSDALYDAAVIRRLAAVDAVAQPVCADLATSLERFSGYGRRLADALDRVRAGEGDWFTSPLVDSYHTVWFELHEDLLATLGLERAEEARTG
jgi:hypothetical protein